MAGSSGWPSTRFARPQRGAPANVRVITDSASDILPNHARAIGVLVMPNRIVLDGSVLRDGIDIIAPACGLSTSTGLDNIRALTGVVTAGVVKTHKPS